MKSNVINIIIVILFWLGMAVFTKIYQQAADKKIEEIRVLKKEIVRQDSINRAHQKAYTDSVRLEIIGMEKEFKAIHRINDKLRKQNEKFDALYNRINTDLPDL